MNYYTNKGEIIKVWIQKALSSILLVGIVFTTAPAPLVVFAEEALVPAPVVEEPAPEPEIVDEPVVEENTPPEALNGDDGSDVEITGGEEVVQTEDGGAGADTTPESDTTEEDNLTLIDTGDAIATSDTENVINTNTTDTQQDDATTTPEDVIEEESEATSTPDSVVEQEQASTTPQERSVATATPDEDGAALGIENDNDAVVGNASVASASTGDNAIQSGGGTALIDTGDALATANVVNVVNTNIVDSQGLLMILNVLASMGSLDLRDLGIFMDVMGAADASESCELDVCGSSSVAIENQNTATITNDVSVVADTGENTIENEEGDGVIVTGDAYASANVVTVANTNIVNSNYLLLSFNNFGDWAGDIAFAGSDLLSGFFGGGPKSGDVSVSNTNDASVANTVSASADTGENTAVSAGGSAVVTGDAQAGGSAINQVNTNLYNADSLMVMIRVHGDWTGSVFGAPEGISWEESDSGVTLYSGDTDLFGSSGGVSTDLSVENHNTAYVDNNISVTALTGNNHITSGDDATIMTGDAYASANVFNVVNTNVIGSNWLLAIFNIFGDWSGSVSFGGPDLWLGGQALKNSTALGPGGEVTYRYTVVNNGGLASDVTVKDIFDSRILEFIDASEGGVLKGDTVEWSLGEIGAGAVRYVEYRARVRGSIGPGNTFFVNESVVSSSEGDENSADNSELLSLSAYRHTSGGESVEYTPRPDMEVEKWHDATTSVALGSTVDYTIRIENNGGLAYHATLYDVLVNDSGDVMFEQNWPLDTIYPNEEIFIEYSIEYNLDTAPGTYTNYAWIEAIGGHPSLNPFYGNIADTEPVSAVVTLFGDGSAGTGDDATGGIVSIGGGSAFTEPESTESMIPIYNTQWLQDIQQRIDEHYNALLAFTGEEGSQSLAAASSPVEDTPLFVVSDVTDERATERRALAALSAPERASSEEVVLSTQIRAVEINEEAPREFANTNQGAAIGAISEKRIATLWWLFLIVIVALLGGTLYRTYGQHVAQGSHATGGKKTQAHV